MKEKGAEEVERIVPTQEEIDTWQNRDPVFGRGVTDLRSQNEEELIEMGTQATQKLATPMDQLERLMSVMKDTAEGIKQLKQKLGCCIFETVNIPPPATEGKQSGASPLPPQSHLTRIIDDAIQFHSNEIHKAIGQLIDDLDL